MMSRCSLLVVVLALALYVPAQSRAAEPAGGWFSLGQALAAQAEEAPSLEGDAVEVVIDEEPNVPVPAEGPPLPLHNVEGVGGAPLTPVAYLVNPGPPGTVIGKPAVSFTYIDIANKDVETLAISETFYRRIEIGYAFSRFGLGTVPDVVDDLTGVDIDDQVYLHIWNARAMVLEEDSFGLPLPAVTVGMNVKYNDGIRDIDNEVGGLLTGLGFARSNGIDFTLHASKTVLVAQRPLIGTIGVRNSQAAQLGYLGFADSCETTLEASLIYVPFDWLGFGYEFRQKSNPYDRAPGLLEDEDNWHSLFAGFLLNEHLSVALVWAYVGDVGNTLNTCAWGVQAKYEF